MVSKLSIIDFPSHFGPLYVAVTRPSLKPLIVVYISMVVPGPVRSDNDQCWDNHSIGQSSRALLVHPDNTYSQVKIFFSRTMAHTVLPSVICIPDLRFETH